MIAVVEDDAGLRTAIEQLLRSAGFRAVTFESAEEFLAHADRAAVECLIADINLPGISGVELVSRLGTNGQRVPAVLITGRRDAATARLRGARRFDIEVGSPVEACANRSPSKAIRRSPRSATDSSCGGPSSRARRAPCTEPEKRKFEQCQRSVNAAPIGAPRRCPWRGRCDRSRRFRCAAS